MFAFLTLFSLLATAVNGHFHLNFPPPRGAFNAQDELVFCGGHTDVTTNRTKFPLSDGFITLTSGHGGFTAGIIISTVENPNSFDNFSSNGQSSNGQQQVVKGYSKEANGGDFCIPLNVSSSGIDGVKDGANVTIQIVFDGGDGNLYQCADLTLATNYSIPSDSATCANKTSESHGHSSASGTATSAGASPTQSGAAISLSPLTAGYTTVLLGLISVVSGLL